MEGRDDAKAGKSKHEALIERLSKPHASTRTASSLESTTTFLTNFANSKRLIESQLATTPKDLKPYIESIALNIQTLEKLVAQNSYFLPPYDLRASLQTVTDLKLALDKYATQLNPRKKFSFRNKPGKKESNLTDPVEQNLGRTDPVDQKSGGELGWGVRVGIWDKRGEVVSRSFRGCEETGEFTLSRMEDCEVRLQGCVRTLYIDKLRNCKVYGGPVMGSVLVEDVEGCVFVLASHQVRIHEAKGCDFYLRVRSRPIIEDSCRVRFAPYVLRYDGVDDDLREVGLDEETGNWANVDDFKWLRAVQSPNWSVLPEDERIGIVDISSSNGGENVGNTV